MRRHPEGAYQGGHRHVPSGLPVRRRYVRHRRGGHLSGLYRAGTGGGGHLHPLCRGRRAGRGQPRLYDGAVRPVPPCHRRRGAAAGQALCHPPLRQLRRGGRLSGDVSGHGAARYPAVRLHPGGQGTGPCAGDDPQDHHQHHQDLCTRRRRQLRTAVHHAPDHPYGGGALRLRRRLFPGAV